MKTKEKVKFWLDKYPHLRDDDNKLCCNIWNEEIKKMIIVKNSSYRDFLRLYAAGQLTAATSIRRARAKLQEEFPTYRGEKYRLRKGEIQNEYLKENGYQVNK
jgi:hypothetical protein|tara:strand:+ start:1174 stop:1482 length:309 start_codon:yes stop_codon:yes gene_type:complete